MIKDRSTLNMFRILFAGLSLGIASLILMSGAVQAESDSQSLVQVTAPPQTKTTPTEPVATKECIECHPDKRDTWVNSPHALAFENQTFQEGWKSMGQPGECLLCHTTNYQEATGAYSHAGVACEACHGAANPEHPAADYPVRSDQESCGACHPATLGQAQFSGHTGTADVCCMDCHDPHGQGVLFENPDDMCMECHQEDLAAMDPLQGTLHLRENITCAGCHTLDVPHTFLYNFRHEDLTAFMTGFDCAAEISANRALQAGSQQAQTILQTKMNWPVVHRVSRARSALKCTDCHEMNENVPADFKLLGYSETDLDKLRWQDEAFPAITNKDLDLLVFGSRPGWSWVWWLLGAAAVFALFEVFVARTLKKPEPAVKDG
jgi:hypothetical protein